jgi:hypothetical protein
MASYSSYNKKTDSLLLVVMESPYGFSPDIDGAKAIFLIVFGLDISFY